MQTIHARRTSFTPTERSRRRASTARARVTPRATTPAAGADGGAATGLASGALPQAPRAAHVQGDRASTALSLGIVTTFLSVVVVLPLAALVWTSTNDGAQAFWDAVSSPQSVAGYRALRAAIDGSQLPDAGRDLVSRLERFLDWYLLPQSGMIPLRTP